MATHREAVAYTVLFERRMLFGVTLFAILGGILWIVAMSTDYWFIVNSDEGSYINSTESFFMRSHSGLWRMCRTDYRNSSLNEDEGPIFITHCHYHQVFPSQEEIKGNPAIDDSVLNYTRTEMAFSILSLCMMLMGVAFSLYAFSNPRYMYKRLAGAVHLITAGTILVVIEVLVTSVQYERESVHFTHPPDALWHFGYSFMLAWITFIAYLSAGITFLVCSRKRKRDKAANEEMALADEPTIIGR